MEYINLVDKEVSKILRVKPDKIITGIVNSDNSDLLEKMNKDHYTLVDFKNKDNK